MEEKKALAVLGSTGCIGLQVMEIISEFPDQFQAEVLTANDNSTLLIEQAKNLKPNVVVIGNKEKYNEVFEALDPLDIKVYCGKEALEQVVEMNSIHVVVNAIIGFHGVYPSLKALKAGKVLALANKESLVAAGKLLSHLSNEHKGVIIPIDSEPSALLQCLSGEFHNPIEKVILTASGGPFRERNLKDLKGVSPEEAVDHPKWKMGRHISVDSATMINKGWEMIEVQWLFGLKPEQIDVVIHPQAIIHSMVQFEDGSVKAQMSLNDMKLPILYALNYPGRTAYGNRRLDFLEIKQLNFEPPNLEQFPCLQLAIDAMKKGGNAPSILLGANEKAVASFLSGKINFTEIININQKCLHGLDFIANPTFEQIEESFHDAQRLAEQLIVKLT